MRVGGRLAQTALLRFVFCPQRLLINAAFVTARAVGNEDWRRSVCHNLTNSKLGWYSHVFRSECDYRGVLGECQIDHFGIL